MSKGLDRLIHVLLGVTLGGAFSLLHNVHSKECYDTKHNNEYIEQIIKDNIMLDETVRNLNKKLEVLEDEN